MIPLIQQEVVNKKGWLKESEFVEMMAIAQSAPGPIALNTAIFVGYKARGVKGVIFSSLGTILPSFIVILLIAFPVILGGLTGANPGTGTPVDAVATGLTYALQYLAMCILLILSLVKSGSWARDIMGG